MGWGTVSQSMKYAYPDWTDSDIGLLGNWGEIMFLVTSVPATWIVETRGARCLQISKSRSSTSREKVLSPIFHFIVKYSYLPTDTFRTYVERHVYRSKLTLKFPGYCRH